MLTLAALCGHLLLNLAEGLWFQQFECQILKLPLEAADAEAVGEGGIDLAGFAGDPLTLLFLQRTQGAHVVQAISQLHQNHTNVTGHRQEHSPQIFRLSFRAVVEVDAAELGDPLHQFTHLRTEVELDLIRGDVGVLDHIMEEPSSDHRGTGTDVSQQISHGHRMDDVWVSTGPELALVELKAEIKGRHQQRLGIGGAALANARRHVGDALPQPLRQSNAVIVRMTDGMTPYFGQRAAHLGRTRAGSGLFGCGGSVEHPTHRVNPWYSVQDLLSFQPHCSWAGLFWNSNSCGCATRAARTGRWMG